MGNLCWRRGRTKRVHHREHRERGEEREWLKHEENAECAEVAELRGVGRDKAGSSPQRRRDTERIRKGERERVRVIAGSDRG